MTDFSHLSKLEVHKDTIKPFTLIDLEGAPVFQTKVAGESNPGYINGLLRLSGSARSKLNSANSKFIDEARLYDRELYPKHVITGWTGVCDSSGNDVEFSEENCEAFLGALPNWIFDKLRLFVTTIENYVDIIDTEGKSGN